MFVVKIFSDGSALNNPGVGAYAAILQYVDPSGKLHEREFFGAFPHTTNNQMELMGVITGLEALKSPCKVQVITDSQYVANAFLKGWIDKWQKNGWISSDKKEVKNVELWKRLLRAAAPHSVSFTWVKGHAGHSENERCDALANGAATHLTEFIESYDYSKER